MPVVFAQNWGEHNSELHNNRDGIHGPSLKFWTKDQLNFDKYDYFPQPMPDVYLTVTPKGIRPRD